MRACEPARSRRTSMRAARRRELDRVREQVPHDLLQPARVAGHRDQRPLQHGDQPEPLLLRRGLGRLHRHLQHGREVDGPGLEADLAAHDPRDVQQVVEELGQGLGAALDDPQGPGHGGLVHVLLAEELRPDEDGPQRRAQLVGHHGQELVLGLVGGLRLQARRLLPARGLLADPGGLQGRHEDATDRRRPPAAPRCRTG